MALAVAFKQYHNLIFTGGGLLLMLLGIMQLTQIKFSLPFHISPELAKHNAVSVYVLGIFPGIATTCRAPVLAGVLALAALPGHTYVLIDKNGVIKYVFDDIRMGKNEDKLIKEIKKIIN